jgi:hypothetical protein
MLPSGIGNPRSTATHCISFRTSTTTAPSPLHTLLSVLPASVKKKRATITEPHRCHHRMRQAPSWIYNARTIFSGLSASVLPDVSQQDSAVKGFAAGFQDFLQIGRGCFPLYSGFSPRPRLPQRSVAMNLYSWSPLSAPAVGQQGKRAKGGRGRDGSLATERAGLSNPAHRECMI